MGDKSPKAINKSKKQEAAGKKVVETLMADHAQDQFAGQGSIARIVADMGFEPILQTLAAALFPVLEHIPSEIAGIAGRGGGALRRNRCGQWLCFWISLLMGISSMWVSDHFKVWLK